MQDHEVQDRDYSGEQEVGRRLSEILQEFPKDELSLLVACSAIEEEFGISVDDRAYASWKSMEDVTRYIEDELSTK